MLTLAVAIFSFFAFILAYNTYGRWLSRRIFQVDPEAVVPSREMNDGVDFVPTKRQVLFGHHFTSIAGTGPIVGPAVAVFWGWLPALVWVVLGSIFVGAVHDFGALFVSLRNRGQTIGEVAGRLINPRARLLFLLILFFALTVVLAIFGLVIASIFNLYPASVLSVWVAMPLAMLIGYWVYRKNGSLLAPSLIALAILYLCVYLGVYHLPLELPKNLHIGGFTLTPIVTWTVMLMVYCFIASVLPVWLLLQPRDYINSHQLVVALALLVIGLGVAGVTGKADLAGSAPAFASPEEIPVGAPPVFPFLFITIACGACSGFHCLVSSGTSSKQIASESDAQFVGYGSMLMEGALAVIVILACCAGLGMGRAETADGIVGLDKVDAAQATVVTGREAWRSLYAFEGKSWTDFKLGSKVSAFVEGGANFLAVIGMPHKLAIGIIAVLVACFAATTLDTATRLQRYVIQELGDSLRIPPLSNKYGATFLAVALGTAVAMVPASATAEPGTGGLILWPLFGATNQLLAGLAFLVLIFYLARRGKPVLFAVVPAIMMTSVPVFALGWQIFGDGQWLDQERYLLVGFGFLILALQAWMVIEALILFPKVKGVLEESLPPLPTTAKEAPAATNC